ncbi:hypothetical protein MJO29_012678 [Puccinia striiformis f. sp. tritici]|uniref:Uncharacterized protein n=3 Tax=Puccinia striiformis TaxID=27350 RepID=A0A0L0VYK7_9BASI|nr:hypothetical protein MJO29_012678 [Puccinia striiformis f. sp. tritici]KNF04085.1 hypothetical protein PSTG_02790 [Puccinia striiformis f. sp. tritici PST-78]POW20964.1 hypothetical protein PSHT_02868 [Puccinia striiformis]
MRVSCLFVTVAVIFAGQNNALPVEGLPNLPVLGNEGHLVNKVTGTLDTVPVVGGLTDGLLGEKNDNLLKVKVAKLNGKNSLLRRQGLPVVSTVGGLVSGVETLPLIGGVESIAPVSGGVTSKLGLNRVLPNDNVVGSLDSVAPVGKGVTSEVKPLNADLPNVKKISSKTDKALPVSSLDGTVPSILKRQSIPLVGSLPVVGGLTSSLPGLGLPSMPAMPALPLAVPGLSSVPVVGGLESAL